MKIGDPVPPPVPPTPGQADASTPAAAGRAPFPQLLQSAGPEESAATTPSLPLATVHKLSLEIDPQALALLASPPATLEIQFESKVFDRLTITIAREAPDPRSARKPLTVQLTAGSKEAAALLSHSAPLLRQELAKRGHEAVITVSVAAGSPAARRGARR